MNKHTRMLVIVLFVILILLAAAITVFYVDVNKDSSSSDSEISAAENAGNSGETQVFQDESGLYGLMDSGGNIILDAEWTELTETGNSCYTARLRTRSQLMTGVIDSEGNVIAPFVYSSIEKLTDRLYAGLLEEDGKYFFYDADFTLLLPEAWDDYAVVDEMLHLKKDDDTYIYGLGAELRLAEINMPRRIRPVSFTLQVRDAQLLGQLERSEWSTLADMLLTYLDAYRRNKLEKLEEITHPERLIQVTNESETDFTWRGSAIDSISVFMDKEDSGTLLHCQMELEAETADHAVKSTELLLTFSPDSDGVWMLYDAAFTDAELS
ncbi:MAG: WG repeat-containing protein [Ruminococcus sp.]|nr:WG repeat-containing protein [Ruminococcus sp.]